MLVQTAKLSLLLLLILPILSMANGQQSAIQAKPLEIGWELWYPYQYRNKQQQLVGLDFDILNRILARAKLTANFTELPWKRHLLFIKSGQMDMAMGASYTKERESYAFFSKPYRQEVVRLYIKAENQHSIKLKSLADLEKTNLLIGVEGGYYYGEQYENLMKSLNFRQHINEVLDIEQNISMLMLDRIDGVLVDPATMQSFIEKYRLQGELVALPIKVYQANIHLMLSKKSTNKALLKKLNQAIDTLQKSGEIQQIIKKWQGQ